MFLEQVNTIILIIYYPEKNVKMLLKKKRCLNILLMIIEIYCEEGNSDNEHSKRKKCLFQKYNLKSVFFEFFRGQFLECI